MKLNNTFFRFLIVGVINTAFGTAVMFLFYNVFHFGYWISSASNYVFGSILSYFLNKHFTFKTKDKSFKSIFKFAVNITLCYFVAYGVAKPVVGAFLSVGSVSLQENLSMLAGMILFVILNFFGQKYFVFR